MFPDIPIFPCSAHETYSKEDAQPSGSVESKLVSITSGVRPERRAKRRSKEQAEEDEIDPRDSFTSPYG